MILHYIVYAHCLIILKEKVLKNMTNALPNQISCMEYDSDFTHQNQLYLFSFPFSASLEHHVAFKATFSPSTLQPPTTGPYKFDRVIFNDRNAYDPVLGVFTAPYSGVYMFTFQIFTHTAERPVIDIKVNGNIAARMILDSTHEAVQSDSTALTVKLSHGDRVWVEAGDHSALDLYGPNHTFFSGALLYLSLIHI